VNFWAVGLSFNYRIARFPNFEFSTVARIVMAMSGGVDSSVAAALLCRAGHDVIGVFMRHGESNDNANETCATSSGAISPGVATPGLGLPIVSTLLDHKQGCCSASDAEDARRVASELCIPFYALNLSDDFARIIDYFVAEYSAARTPNPCIMCNNWLKFGKLFEYADSVNAEFVATGHYAQIKTPDGLHDNGDPVLLRGHDADKDQSYVLFGVQRQHLSRMMFPVGGFRKNQIRDLARELGLRVADKPDSQEICFVSSGDHADFVRRRRDQQLNAANSSCDTAETATATMTRDTSGDIVLTDGTVVGQHNGIEAFTIGQRKGLRVAMGQPYYVIHIDGDSRRVQIGPREELACSELTADRANWLVEVPHEPFRALVQIRYNSSGVPAQVEPLENGRFRVEFDEPCYGIAPGQAAVCYDDNRVLGGGWIE
jgi:tRNA-uridine 2-sulfurtransferase